MVKDRPPIENSFNPEYNKNSFYASLGDKPIKGIRAKYSYHKKISDPNKIIAYVIVDGEKKGMIDLGSFHDKESLLSKSIRRMDEKFKGEAFVKSDIYKLGKDIEGNRQPTKAIMDMAALNGYIIKKGQKYYQRTNKQLPKSGLDRY